jgi:hypothetical protein
MDQDRGEPRYDVDEADVFTQAISVQAAARAARFATRPRLTYFELQEAFRKIDLQERLSRLRSFKLVLAFAIGAAVYAGIMYYTAGINLRSPLLSPSALAETTPLPVPSSTAAAQSLPPSSATAAAPALPPAVVVDPAAALQQPPSVVAAPVVPVALKPAALTPEQIGLSPTEILEVQTRLEAAGMKPGRLDGILGPRTIAAIGRYEETKGGPQTGIVDRAILGRLRQEANQSISQTQTQENN